MSAVYVSTEYAAAHLGLHHGQYVCLAVGDTGIGMSQPLVERIFEPYFTTKEEGKGTGLGLATVHGIVRTYEGAINIYSEEGQGTELKVYLPVFDVATGQAAQAALLEDIPRGNGETVLLVDDEPSVVDVHRAILSTYGYQVLGCASAREALAIFAENEGSIDLLLTDRTMPNMSGIVLARMLREKKPGLPVILITGFSTDDIEQEARDSGIHAVLKKPTEPHVLCAVIREALGK